jgi:uncharacterized Rmd1/YagE family protein
MPKNLALASKQALKTGRQRKKSAARARGGDFNTTQEKKRVYFCCMSQAVDMESLHEGLRSVDLPEWEVSMFTSVLHLYIRDTDTSTFTEEAPAGALSPEKQQQQGADREATPDQALWNSNSKEVFIFDFGCVVFWGFEPADELEFMDFCTRYMEDPLEAAEFEASEDDMAYSMTDAYEVLRGGRMSVRIRANKIANYDLSTWDETVTGIGVGLAWEKQVDAVESERDVEGYVPRRADADADADADAESDRNENDNDHHAGDSNRDSDREGEHWGHRTAARDSDVDEDHYHRHNRSPSPSPSPSKGGAANSSSNAGMGEESDREMECAAVTWSDGPKESPPTQHGDVHRGNVGASSRCSDSPHTGWQAHKSSSANAATAAAAVINARSAYHPSAGGHVYLENDLYTISKYADPRERLALSFAMAQSSILAVFEARIQKKVEEFRYIPETFATNGKVRISGRRLGNMIGEVFVVRHDVNLHTEILDTPDYFWNNRDVEDLYKMVSEYLEMDSRTAILNKRLDMLREMLTMLQMQNENEHAVKLEWIVILLIVASIAVELITVVGKMLNYWK